MIGAGGMWWDSTNSQWVRARDARDGLTSGGVLAAGDMVWDPAAGLFYKLKGAYTDGMDKLGLAASGPALFNGTTYDRERSSQGDGVGGTGYPVATPHILDAATSTYWRAVNSYRDAEDARRLQGAGDYLFNGATFDRQRGNTEGTALASAARTASVSSGIITNHNARGVIVALNVTVAGTGTLDLAVVNFDSATGNWTAAVPLGSITTTGTYDVVMYPGAAEANTSESNVVASLPLGRSWFVRVNHSNASSWTYVAAYSLIL